MYDPTIGRFTSLDPTGFAAGDDNLYRVEGDNPTNETDPSGLQPGYPSTPGNPVPLPHLPYPIKPDNGIGGFGNAGNPPVREAPSKWDRFRNLGVKNKIKYKVIEAIIEASECSDPFPLGTDRCLAWVENFRAKISKELKTPDFWELHGTGLIGEVRTWKIDANFWLTNSHAAYRITFPDGSEFYFDNKSLCGQRITLPNEIPAKFKDEK